MEADKKMWRYQHGMAQNGRERPRHQHVEPVHGTGYWDAMQPKKKLRRTQRDLELGCGERRWQTLSGPEWKSIVIVSRASGFKGTLLTREDVLG